MVKVYRYVSPGAWSVDLGNAAVRLGRESGYAAVAETAGVAGSTVVIDDATGSAGHSGDGILGLKQFVVDEQDIISDRLTAFKDMPVEMGLAAARLRPDLVYALLIKNSALGADSVALFHAMPSNLNTTAALSAVTLKAAIAALEKQQMNSVNLNLRASHVIVPSDLKHLAAELIKSATIIYGADDETVRGTQNTLASEENLQLVSDARLANGVTDPTDDSSQSGSTSTWFLASSMGRNIEVGYLRGTGRVPQVRSFVLTQGQWGMGWDINMDIGAKALDFRGMQKNTA